MLINNIFEYFESKEETPEEEKIWLCPYCLNTLNHFFDNCLDKRCVGLGIPENIK